jgi:PKD repeat protein
MKRLFLNLALLFTYVLALQAQSTTGTTDFTFQISALNVQFNNTSVPLNGFLYHWYFGDGSSSDSISPHHQYSNAGVYTVCLYKKTPNNVFVDSTCKTVMLTSTNTCQVDFRDSTTGPLTKKFFPIVSDPFGSPLAPQLLWRFGDGDSSTLASPTHQYAQPGTYTVCVRAQYANGCVAEKCKSIVINPTTVCQVDFRDSAIAPLTEQFYPLLNTGGIVDSGLQIQWTFGDGTLSTIRNPVHQYVQPGTYNVCLRVVYTNGCVAEKCKLITVLAPTTCVVEFRDSLLGQATYQFWSIPTSNAISSYLWHFGDSSTSTLANPIHHFNQPGVYNVCLRVIYANGCVAEKCKTFVVTNPVTCVADFRDSLVGPFSIQFNAIISNSATTSYQWNFGDGSTASGPNPLHQFPGQGAYHVCLRVIYANGCVAEKCKDITLPLPNTASCEVRFTDSAAGPNSISFHAITMPGRAVNSYQWNFGDGIGSNLANPVHSYASSGTYNVCLVVKYSVPGTINTYCEARSCHVVIVTGPSCGAIINDSIVGPLKVQFRSILPRNDVVSLRWNFGDGSTSLVRNPLKQYARGGRYRVCLNVRYQYDSCEANVCETVVLSDEPCRDSFRVEPYFGGLNGTTVNNGLVYQFFSIINRTDALIYQWNFGDGSSSMLSNPVKTYQQPGLYNVCLKVTFANGCIANYCRTVNIVRTCRVEILDSIISPRTYKFSVYSSRPGIVQYLWRFGDSTTSTLATPIHTFQQVGNYTVCVRTVYTDGCVAEDCDNLNVFRIATSSGLQVSAYPLPAENQISFRIDNTIVTGNSLITLYSSTGSVVKQQQVLCNNNSFTVDISELKQGSYFAEIKVGNNITRKSFLKM